MASVRMLFVPEPGKKLLFQHCWTCLKWMIASGVRGLPQSCQCRLCRHPQHIVDMPIPAHATTIRPGHESRAESFWPRRILRGSWFGILAAILRLGPAISAKQRNSSLYDLHLCREYLYYALKSRNDMPKWPSCKLLTRSQEQPGFGAWSRLWRIDAPYRFHNGRHPATRHPLGLTFCLFHSIPGRKA